MKKIIAITVMVMMLATSFASITVVFAETGNMNDSNDSSSYTGATGDATPDGEKGEGAATLTEGSAADSEGTQQENPDDVEDVLTDEESQMELQDETPDEGEGEGGGEGEEEPTSPVIDGNPLYVNDTYIYVRLFSKLTNKYNEYYQNYEGNAKIKVYARWYQAKVEQSGDVTKVKDSGNDGEDVYKTLVSNGWQFTYSIKVKNDTEETDDDEIVKENISYDKIKKGQGITLKIKNQKAYYLEVKATNPSVSEEPVTGNSLPRIVKYEFLDAPESVTVTCPEHDNVATIKWKKVDKAVCYAVYMSKNGKIPKKPLMHTEMESGVVKYVRNNLTGPKTYTFYVRAMFRNNSGTTGGVGGSGGNMWTVSKPASDKLKIKDCLLDNEIKVIKWKATLRYKATLYSDSSCRHSKGSLSKGMKVAVIDKSPRRVPRGGRPARFKVQVVKNGKVKKTGWVKFGPIDRVPAVTAYKKGKAYDYSVSTKERYVNVKGFKSSTSYLMWINTYTQRVNMFRRKDGKWKLEKSWRCTTGKFYHPTGLSYGNTIFKHQAVRYRYYPNSTTQYYYKYLSYFTEGNSFHTNCWLVKGNRVVKKVNKNLQPGTAGCIRMYVPDALWIYKNVPLHTKVIVH